MFFFLVMHKVQYKEYSPLVPSTDLHISVFNNLFFRGKRLFRL